MNLIKHHTFRFGISLFFVFMQSFLWAQSPDTLFSKANKLFQNGKNKQAIEQYLAIEKMGVHSADLYYNLGNCYYKNNEVAPSIYNFEKALLLDPKHKEALHNIAFARRMTIDVIEPLPKTFLQRINESIIYQWSYNTWAWFAIFFAFLSATCFLFYYFSDNFTAKKTYFVSSFIGLGLFFIVLSMGIKARHHYQNDQPAIIYVPQVSVLSEPMFSGSELFILHVGTKVQVEKEENQWAKIKIADGKSGWLENSKLRKLK